MSEQEKKFLEIVDLHTLGLYDHRYKLPEQQ